MPILADGGKGLDDLGSSEVLMEPWDILRGRCIFKDRFALDRSPKIKKRKLDDDTYMADLAAVRCLTSARKKKFFTLEHPGRSLALHLPSWRRPSPNRE